ncbi:MAG: hypothetical protein PHG23_00695 [Candidatus Pacebacteria bacterium]|nr:hypothetical protein [Candidatus Paceibacterota bacterium]
MVNRCRYKCRRKENKVFYKSLFYISGIISLLSLAVATASMAVGAGMGFFDTEASQESELRLGVLDFDLLSHSVSFVVPANGETISSEALSKTGSIDFRYRAVPENISGDLDFCDDLKIKINNDDASSLQDYISSAFDFSGNQNFNIAFELSGIHSGVECKFDLVIDGWQTDYAEPGKGFSNTEIISVTVTPKEEIIMEAAVADSSAVQPTEETDNLGNGEGVVTEQTEDPSTIEEPVLPEEEIPVDVNNEEPPPAGETEALDPAAGEEGISAAQLENPPEIPESLDTVEPVLSADPSLDNSGLVENTQPSLPAE